MAEDKEGEKKQLKLTDLTEKEGGGKRVKEVGGGKKWVMLILIISVVMSLTFYFMSAAEKPSLFKKSETQTRVRQKEEGMVEKEEVETEGEVGSNFMERFFPPATYQF